MEIQQARFILGSFRPSGRDADDPQFAEAIQAAREDVELGEWFEREQELDDAIGRKLREVTPAPEFKAAVLASLPHPVRRRSLPPRVLALAALLVALGACAILVNFPLKRGTDLASYRAGMTRLLSAGGFNLDYADPDPTHVRAWLARAGGGSAGVEIPAGMNALATRGCRILSWNNQRVTLICFRKNEDTVHLFVVPREALRDPPSGTSPRLEAVNGWTTAAWARGDQVYLLSAHADEADVLSLL
jgi:hypothetical protein